jgi:hypothetical protein
MCASLILRDTEATAASSTRNTAQGIFYKKQVLQRDEVCPHSLNIFYSLFIGHKLGARWRSGKGTTLQSGRSRVRFPMVSLEFFIDIILPVALWPCGKRLRWSRG